MKIQKSTIIWTANLLETKVVTKYASWKIISFIVPRRVRSLLLPHNNLLSHTKCAFQISFDPMNTDYTDKIPFTGLQPVTLSWIWPLCLRQKWFIQYKQTSGSQPSSDKCYSQGPGNIPSLHWLNNIYKVSTERRCTYYITLRCVTVTTVAVEKK
jgi:hypothetical protein